MIVIVIIPVLAIKYSRLRLLFRTMDPQQKLILGLAFVIIGLVISVVGWNSATQLYNTNDEQTGYAIGVIGASVALLGIGLIALRSSITGNGTSGEKHFCTQCGSAIKAGAAFCSHCGAKQNS